MISMGALSRRTPPPDWRGSLLIGDDELGIRTAKPLGFHDYVSRLGEPSANVMLTKPSRNSWHVARHPLGRIVVQSGATGAATIVDGVSPPGSFVFLLRNSDCACPMSLNGQPVAAHDIAIIPPAKQFALTSRGPHKWISLSVPPEALEEAGFSKAQLHALAAAASLVLASNTAERLLAAAAMDAIDLIQNSPISLSLDRFNDIERALLADLFAAISSGDVSNHSARRTIGCSLDRTPHQALAFVRMQDGLDVNVEHLCRAIDVTERSLLRAFHKFFGVGPTQYMKLRRLNKVHCELQAPDCRQATVTGVMTSCGVTEFGRFAGAYRALFGETPSETLKRKLESAGRMRTEAGQNLRRLQTQYASMRAAS